jgi:ectoine hydroxylase-related dioxygenase (phytanoyl-CoA dioxygenase family)
LTANGSVGNLAASLLGPGARPVRALLFDKTPERNWALGWHQDRTICVRKRRDTPGFAKWTVKQGLQHVEPPFALLKRMVTLRVHLDEVPTDNAPLLVAPGSHRFGRIAEEAVEEAVWRCGRLACTASAGDVWIYATTILHASERSWRPKRRRVLQVDYSAEELPGGLQWTGV